MLILSAFLLIVESVHLVEYRFGYNYGSKFQDFSGNGNHGESNGIFCTDRGAYFYGLKKGITIPTLSYPTSVSIVFWILSKGDGLIYYHGNITSGNFTLFKDSSDLIGKSSILSTIQTISITNGIISNTWVLSVVLKDSDKYSLRSTSSSTTSQVTFADNFVSKGLGGNDNFNSFKGFIWYFSINTNTFLSTDYIETTGTYSSIGPSISCDPKFKDPYYGSICISTEIDPGYDAYSQICSQSKTTCSASYVYNCVCLEFCYFDIITKVSSCSNTISSTPTCTSPAVERQGLCCHATCGTCSNETTCLTCIDPHGIVSGGTCICGPGFYGTVSSDSVSTCQPCIANCLTCIDQTTCSLCQDSFTLESNTCVCSIGTYLDDSSILVSVCETCSLGCTNCTSSICYDCDDINSIPSSSFCKCIDGYYDTGATSTLICAKCSGLCSTCDQASLCLTCNDTLALPVNGVCKCKTGYQGYPKGITGTGCYANCKIGCTECTNSGTCTYCTDENSFAKGTDCFCLDGFYWKQDVNVFCHSCLDTCWTCNSSDTCLTCFDENSEVVEGVCHCIDGYYGEPEGRSGNGSCIKCPSECILCSGKKNCSSCVDDNAEPADGICTCKNGFFQNKTLKIQTCVKCRDQCETCENEEDCLTCKSLNSFLSDSGECVCNQGFYNITELTEDDSCIECDSLCASCTYLEICQTCRGNFTELIDQQCMCMQGYYKPTTKSRDCKRCEALNDNDECITDCPLSTILINGLCEKCPDNCGVCESTSNCSKCLSNFNIESGQCVCQKGEQALNSFCTAKYFSAYLEVNSNNTIYLNFTETPEKSLNKDDLLFEYRGKQRKINLKVLNSFTYQINLQNTDIIIDFDFTLTLPSPIYSTENSQLKTDKLSDSFSPEILTLSNSFKTTIQTLVTLSFLSSTLSNSSPTWVLLSTIQIISYMPLANLDFSSNILEFLHALSRYSIIPNIMKGSFDSDSSTEASEREQRSGIKSTVLWINLGQSFTLFISYITLIPFAIIGSWLPYVSGFCYKVLQNYQFRFFFRFWIQFYLDFGVFALIQLKAVRFI